MKRKGKQKDKEDTNKEKEKERRRSKKDFNRQTSKMSVISTCPSPAAALHLILWSTTCLSLPFLFLLAAAGLLAGWLAGLAQRQINTSVHESCSPHTPKTIAGGLCAGRPGLLSSLSAHTSLLFCELEMFVRAGI